MKHRIHDPVVFAAALVFAYGAVHAQPATVSELRSAAFTSLPEDAPALQRVDEVIAGKRAAGELVPVSARPDRTIPGRVHEHLAQVHRGVPVYGAGFTRQRDDGGTVSVFGTLYDEIELGVVPTIDAGAARGLLTAVAGAPPATSEPPSLVVFPTPLGKFVLAWRAPMGDYRTHFIDAHTGEPVHRFDHVHRESAIGFGTGLTGAPQKLSVWRTDEGYQAWDRLRPAELVTVDVNGEGPAVLPFLLPLPGWQDAVATDDDNEWSNPAIVDGHAHLGLTYDYLHQRQGWQGHDGRNGRLISLVNTRGVENAYFLSPPLGPEGEGALFFGEWEDGTPFVPLDVVAHEFMHAVTYFSVLERTGEPLLDTHGFVLGPSSFTFRDETHRCGDTYTFAAPEEDEEEEEAPFLCLDEEGQPTRSRDGRFALFMNHGGAINEAYSDIIAASVEFATHPPGDGPLQADYLIGEDMGPPLRRLDSPRSILVGGLLPYPEAAGQEFRFVVALVGENLIRYTGFVHKEGRFYRSSREDYDGIHWNSTLLSHAFFLAVEGGQHANGRTVQGVGAPNRGLVEQAFFRAMTDLAPSRVGLVGMGRAIRQSAIDLHGAGSSASVAIDQALSAAGI